MDAHWLENLKFKKPRKLRFPQNVPNEHLDLKSSSATKSICT